jgi:hypothetical protein
MPEKSIGHRTRQSANTLSRWSLRRSSSHLALISRMRISLLRRFTPQYTTLLGWAGFQALQFMRVPSNVRQSALLVELAIRPSGDAQRQYVLFPLNAISCQLTSFACQIHHYEHTHRHFARPTRRSRCPTVHTLAFRCVCAHWTTCGAQGLLWLISRMHCCGLV